MCLFLIILIVIMREKKPRLKKFLVPAFIVIGLAVAALVAWRFTPLPDILGISPAPTAPLKADDYLNAANQSWKEKNYSEAYDQFKKVLEIEPGNFEAQLGLANALKEQGKLDEALPEYDKVIALNEKDPRSYAQIGSIYEQKKELDKAVDSYKKYIDMAPAGAEYDAVSKKVKDIEAQLKPETARPGEELVAKKREEREPKTRPKKEVAPKPSPEEKRKADVSAVLDRGINAFNNEDYDGCIRQMQEVLKLDSRNNSALYFLSEARKMKSEKAKEEGINNRLRLAQSAFARGDYQECVKQTEEVLRLAPGNASALSLLDRAEKKQEEKNTEQQIRDGLSKAQQAYQGENYQECIIQARQVLSLSPDNAQAKEYLNLANEKITISQINALIGQYNQSVNDKNLLVFYENSCSSQCYAQVERETKIMISYFEKLQSSISNIEVRFKGTDQAEATFMNTISGTKAGTTQEVLKGLYKWDLEKQGNSWKIVNITFTRRG